MATTAEQYELVYQGICAVAANCDGAQTQDRVGFNGQDTHFGRRVASVPFDQWTEDVKAEAARIALTYKGQIMAYTGLDMGELDVVKDAQDRGTNHIARDVARGYERKAKGADKVALRKIDVVGTMLGIFYDKRDPEFGELLETCKALPGRSFDWDLKCNVVPVSDAFADFVLTWDFPITEAAQALLASGPPEHMHITLADNGQKVVIDTPYDVTLVEAIKALPGRSWNGGLKINTADVSPLIIDFAAKFNLVMHPDARAACEGAQAALEAAEADSLREEDRRVVMAHVSRQKDPGALPPVFLDMLSEILPADIAQKVITRMTLPSYNNKPINNAHLADNLNDVPCNVCRGTGKTYLEHDDGSLSEQSCPYCKGAKNTVWVKERVRHGQGRVGEDLHRALLRVPLLLQRLDRLVHELHRQPRG